MATCRPCLTLFCVLPDDLATGGGVYAVTPLVPVVPALQRVDVANDPQTATCTPPQTGTPVTIPAGMYHTTLFFTPQDTPAKRQAEEAAAKASLNAIALQQAMSQLVCTTPSNILKVQGYTDNMFIGSGALDGNPAWDGIFHFKWSVGTGIFEGSHDPDQLSINGGKTICNAYILYTTGHWQFTIYGGSLSGVIWQGTGGVNVMDPTGVYTLIGGDDASPATVTIVNTPGTYTPTNNADCLPA